MILFLCFFLASCGKSNEQYIQDTEEKLDSILSEGVPIESVLKYLTEHGYSYLQRAPEECLDMRKYWKNAPCKGGPYIHTRIAIKKILNPVESGAHVYFFFDESAILSGYEIQIKHTFL